MQLKPRQSLKQKKRNCQFRFSSPLPDPVKGRQLILLIQAQTDCVHGHRMAVVVSHCTHPIPWQRSKPLAIIPTAGAQRPPRRPAR